jgi:putative MATE family efflux protein
MTEDRTPAPKPGGRVRWRDRDHTRGRLSISLLVLALPSFATSLSGVVFQLTDLAFISRLGDAPMASVVIVNQTLRQTFFMLLMGGSFGTQALIARAVGAGKIERAEHIAGQAIALAFLISAALMLVGGLFPEFLFSLPGPDPSFYEYGVPYVRLIFLLNFGVVGTLFFSSILGGAGDTTTPLFVTLVQTAVALSAEWVLIFGHLGAPALGVRGVALGVATGQITAMVLGISVLFGGRARVHLRFRHLVPDWAVLAQIARLSWPPAIQMVSGVAMTFAFMRLAGSFGESVQAAYAIGLRLGMLAPMLCFPLASACATLVGQALGSGNVPRAWQTVRTGLAVHGTIMATLAIGLGVFRGEIIAAFSDDPEVVRIGTEYLGYLAINFLLWAFYFPFLRSLQGAGDFLAPMAISLGATCLVAIPLAWLLTTTTSLGPTAIWISQLVGAFLVTAGTGLRLATGRWTRGASQSRR